MKKELDGQFQEILSRITKIKIDWWRHRPDIPTMELLDDALALDWASPTRPYPSAPPAPSRLPPLVFYQQFHRAAH